VELLREHEPVRMGCGRGELPPTARRAGVRGQRRIRHRSGHGRARPRQRLRVEQDRRVLLLGSSRREALGAVVAIQVIEHHPTLYEDLSACSSSAAVH